jgi:putative MATE family efflux protein
VDTQTSARDRDRQVPALDPTSLDQTGEAVLPAPRKRAPGRAEIGLTPDGRLRTGRLAGLSLTSAIITVGWPVLVDSFLNSLVGLVDTAIAAALSTAAADAIGNASYTIWFVGLFFMALDVGATALISRAVGAGRMAVANAAVGQALQMAVVVGAALGALLGIVARPLAGLMSSDTQSIADFTTYMRVFAFDVPFLSVLVAGIACLRGSGDTVGPMRTMIVVNLVNLALGWALAGPDYMTAHEVGGKLVQEVVVHNPFPFKLGVMGIALGTLLAHATGAALIIATLLRGSHGLTIKRHRLLKPHWHTMRRMIRVGLPNFFETFGMWLGNFPIILMAGWIGADLVGAHVLTIRVEAFSFQPGFAIGIAAAALAGQYLGAGSPRLARHAILICTGAASAIMGTMGLVFMLFGRQIVGVFSPQAIHLEWAPKLLFITGCVQIPFAIGIVLRQAMRGAGDVKVVMYLTWISTYAARLPLAYLLSGVEIPWHGGVIHNPLAAMGFKPNLSWLWIGLCIEVVIRCGLFTGRFLDGGWAKARV